MATQRRITKEKPEDLAPAVGLRPGGDPGTSNIKPAVPAETIYKLLGFTVAIFALPILSYYASVNTIFGGNSTYAGGLAALVVNIVLFAYVIVAMLEDSDDRREAERSGRIPGKVVDGKKSQ